MSAKIYAVCRGRRVGLFANWDQCKEQIDRYPGAVFKSFESRDDAENYLRQHGCSVDESGTSGSPPQSKTTGKRSEPSFIRHESRLKVTRRCRSLAFIMEKREVLDQEHFSNQNTRQLAISDPASSMPFSHTKSIKTAVARRSQTLSSDKAEIVAVEVAGRDAEPTESLVLLGSSKEKASASKTKTSRTTQAAGQTAGKIVVYTDGSCLGNGQSSARAGYGIFYGHDDSRNVSLRLEGPRQSNQRAELMAVLHVLRNLNRKTVKAIEIRSDSKYTIKSSTIWMKCYSQSNGKSKKNYVNLDLMMEIYNLTVELEKEGIKVDFEYVAAHSGLEGNEMADSLAKQGALQPERL